MATVSAQFFLPGSFWMLFSRGTDEACKLTASEQPKQPR